MENETNEKEMYQQPLSFKHQALVDLTLAKSPKDTTEKDPVKEDLDNKTPFEKNPTKDFNDKNPVKDLID